jgi:hypothetical protein
MGTDLICMRSMGSMSQGSQECELMTICSISQLTVKLKIFSTSEFNHFMPLLKNSVMKEIKAYEHKLLVMNNRFDLTPCSGAGTDEVVIKACTPGE